MPIEDDREDISLVAVYLGVVVDNVDPLKAGRVTVRIPGMMDESPWALPMALPGSGEKQSGWFIVPPKGATVGVWFRQGDPEHPCYTSGPWGAPGGVTQVPTPVQEVTPEEAPDIRCFETPRFLLTFDDREGRCSVELKDKVSGDGVLLDAETRAIRVKGTAAVIIEAVGAVDIRGLAVTLNGRPVKDSKEPI